MFVSILATVVVVWLSRGRYAETGKLSLSAVLSMCVSLVALAAGFTFYLVSPARFERYGHEMAAITLFSGNSCRHNLQRTGSAVKLSARLLNRSVGHVSRGRAALVGTLVIRMIILKPSFFV